MVALAYQPLSTNPATTQTPVTPGLTNTVPPNDRGFLLFENTGTAKTVLIITPAGLDYTGAILPDLGYALGATTGRLRIGPLPAILANPTTGLIDWQLDSATGVTVVAASI